MVRKKNKRKSSGFSFARRKKKTKAQQRQRVKAVRSTLVVFTILLIFAATGLGLVFLEKYINSNSEMDKRIGKLELLAEPYWVSKELRDKIVTAAAISQNGLILEDGTARLVAENLADVAWLDDVIVKVTNETIQVGARYRMPRALIKDNNKNFYIDDELVILDYVEIDKLPIVEIKGIQNKSITFSMVGSCWQRDDVAAAVALLKLLSKMDAEIAENKPLLNEISYIDVSNYNGRENSRKPHIILCARDGTEILWGAEKGKWHLHLEARDEEKLALLYNTYEAMGTLQLRSNHKGSFIDLMKPQKSLSLPIDRY